MSAPPLREKPVASHETVALRAEDAAEPSTALRVAVGYFGVLHLHALLFALVGPMLRPYVGGIGWVDADRRCGDLNVAIRTFWIEDDALHFGTGGGITYGSDPAGEWAETELKAQRLLRVASSPGEPVAVGHGAGGVAATDSEEELHG